MDFKEWLELEDVQEQQAQLASFIKSEFPNSSVTSNEFGTIATLKFADRIVKLEWSGLNPDNPYDQQHPAVADHGFVKIDFNHKSNASASSLFGAGMLPVKQGGVQDNTLAFVRGMNKLIGGLKQLNINIYFTAAGLDRADAYAKTLQKHGYKLGKFAGQSQLWTISDVPLPPPTENPYTASAADLLKRKQMRQAQYNQRAQQQPPPPPPPARSYLDDEDEYQVG